MADRTWEAALAAHRDNASDLETWYRGRGLYRTHEVVEFLRPNMLREGVRAKLLDVGRRSTSHHLCELIASHFAGHGQHGVALELRLRALAMMPRWDVDAATRTLPAMALDLLRRGDVDAAETVAEHALSYDPASPPAVAVLAQVALLRDDATRAFRYIGYLDAIKWPRELAKVPLTALAKSRGLKKPRGVPAHVAEVSRLGALDEGDALRAFVTRGLGGSRGELLRHSGLVAAMSGRHALARRTAQYIQGLPRSSGVVADRMHSNAVARVLEQLPAGEAKARAMHEELASRSFVAINEWKDKGDVAALEHALLDPETAFGQDAFSFLNEMKANSPLVELFARATDLSVTYVGWGPDEPPRKPQTLPKATKKPRGKSRPS